MSWPAGIWKPTTHGWKVPSGPKTATCSPSFWAKTFRFEEVPTMTISRIQSILNAHGVPSYIAAGRIYADTLGAYSGPFEEVEDLTDFTHPALMAWLGY
jgi:hypothetical protein